MIGDFIAVVSANLRKQFRFGVAIFRTHIRRKIDTQDYRLILSDVFVLKSFVFQNHRSSESETSPRNAR